MRKNWERIDALIDAHVALRREERARMDYEQQHVAKHVLYLDFDNVLHGDVLCFRKPPALRPATQGQVLFENAPMLERLLEPYPDLRVVLSTSWVRERSFYRARKALPTSLQQRVIGATFHKRYMRKDEFSQIARYHQIIADVERRRPSRWLAIDDDLDGWPEHALMNVVPMPLVRGLGDSAAALELERRLAQVFRNVES
jgi:hypothetical protein